VLEAPIPILAVIPWLLSGCIKTKTISINADKNNKADGWIIACLRDNFKLEATKEKHKKNYDLTFDDI